ncbi:MAG: hypothetical protein MR741_06205 [Clostridiales bacterium]|nr:hypothetical protein [Clostridiales bacterium]MDD7054468.1 hypothetical protein [Clostridiales bacterium]MDY5190468.1 hypothetical protein [Eubacteriales bacterium]
MKRKSIITVLALVLVLALSLSIFSACNKKHKYSSEWKFDEKTHWHECTAKKHTDTTEKTPHVFTWTEKTPAGFHTDKVEKGVCECGYETERTISGTATHTYGEEWKKDESGHWHDSTCDATAPTHDAIKGNFAAHTFDEGVETKPADYGVVGKKKFTCTICGYEKTEDIDALDAQDNEIKLAEGKTLGKEYDGEAISITKGDFVIDGNREPAFMFKAKGAKDDAYAVTAPINAGEYTVKVSVAATAEWKSATKTFDFAITPMVISVAWEPTYNNTNIFTGAPAELLDGDEAMITVTMSSANVGAEVQSFEITGKDAGNYSLAIEDINVEIIKADIVNFTISNADAYNNIVIGAQSIPDPTTNYVEIGTGYGERTIFWEKELENGVWSRNLTKEEVINFKTGTFRVHIKYAEGANYNFGDAFVKFTMKAKSRTLTVKSIEDKMYDGKQVANFTYENLVYKLSTPLIEGGVENITPISSGEKYVEFREVGGEWGRNLNVANVLTNAGEYEYRIGVTATDEWEAVVSDIKTFTIKPYEFVLKLGYVKNQQNPSNDRGKTFLFGQYENLIEGQKIQLWLDNEKAGFKTSEGNNSVFYFIPDQKKKVTTDCFFLKIGNITNPVMENYKIVPQSPSVTTVEITVVNHDTTEKSTSGSIQAANQTEQWIRTTVEKGYFQVGQTVEVYRKVIVGNSATYVKVGEAKITEIKVGSTTSASGCAIPSDGTVFITLDKGFSDLAGGKIVAK